MVKVVSRKEDSKVLPLYASEDFAFYTKIVPGAFMFIGTGKGVHHGVHESKFNFNDDLIEPMCKLWLQLVLDRTKDI